MPSSYLKTKQLYLIAIVDRGSPAQFVKKKTAADRLLANSKNVKLYPTLSVLLDISYVDYDQKAIVLFRVADISSLNWKNKSGKVFLSENRTTCILNLDLQNAIGWKKTPTPPPPQNSWSWRNWTIRFLSILKKLLRKQLKKHFL